MLGRSVCSPGFCNVHVFVSKAVLVILRKLSRLILRLFVCVATANCFYGASAACQQFNWQSVTSFTSVSDMLYRDGSIWAATDGGVFCYTVASNTFIPFNNTDGLSSNRAASLAVDGSGNIWAGMTDGKLNVIDPGDYTIRHVTIDPEPLVVHGLARSGGSLYIALDFGVSLFLLDKEEVNSTFRTLGRFPINTAVRRLYIHDGMLWAATGYGIAAVSLSSPNLQDPQYWSNYSMSEGLISNDVSSFASHGDMLFAGTTRGVCRFDGGAFVFDGLSDVPITALAVVGESLYAAAPYAVFQRTGSGQWTLVEQGPMGITAFAEGSGGVLWAGHANDGLYRYDPGQGSWANYLPNTPQGSSFEEIVIDGEGRMWAASGQSANNGLYLFEDSTWERYNMTTGLPSNNVTGITEGPDGRIWAGTPGQGAMILERNAGGLDVIVLNAASGHLAGSDTPNFVIVPKIRRDRNGVIWILNKYANNGRALVAVTPENEWHYFSVSDGLITNIVTQIAFDEFDRVWIGTASSGLNMLDYAGTLADKSDDEWRLYTVSDGLQSNRIGGIAAEEGNGVWVATQDGIDHLIEGLPVQGVYGALSNFTTAVVVDPAHNKWFGTPNGISILHSDDFTWTHFTTDNSDLVYDEIISIYFHGETGSAYVSTPSGLSIAGTPYKSFPEGAAQVSVYPNPFIVDGSSRQLVIENILLNSTVKIFTITGRMVRQLTGTNGGVAGTQAFWDGLDEDGDPVPTGVYLVVAGTDNSSHSTAKVAIIRR